jgi:hypothetical protein
MTNDPSYSAASWPTTRPASTMSPGQHDVARPAAGTAVADEDPVRAGPVLGDQSLAAVGQGQRHGTTQATKASRARPSTSACPEMSAADCSFSTMKCDRD